MRFLLSLLFAFFLFAHANAASFDERAEVRAFIAEMHERNSFDSDELLHCGLEFDLGALTDAPTFGNQTQPLLSNFR